jgi:hypothetical protein
MSTNIYARLRAVLPEPPQLLAKVLAHNADGTSTIELPLGLASTPVAPGVATGSTLRVRGTQVAVGQRAWVRNGVIEAQAPTGNLVDAVVGVVVAEPFGPAPLAAADAAIPAQSSAVSAPVSLDLAPFWLDGWPPRAYSVASGTLPAGLVLDAATGLVTGARTGTATATVVFRCTDTTGAAVSRPGVIFSAA